MEKYRQFEDQSNGINPFTIPSKKKKKSMMNTILFIPLFFLAIIKFFIYVLIANTQILIQTLLKLPIINKFTRRIEVMVNIISAKILLYLLGVYNLTYKYKRQDNKKTPNIIFSSQSTVIDWLILMHNYSPKFLAIVKSENNEEDYLIELSYKDVFSYSIGLVFPEQNKNHKKFDYEKYIEQPSQIPLVIFPECTKTNRKAILSIRSNILDSIYDLAQKHQKILLRGEIIVNKNEDCNTTDAKGYKSLFQLLRSCNTIIEIYSQDFPNDSFNIEGVSYDKKKFPTPNHYKDYLIQEDLMEPNNRNIVSLSSKDHIEFLKYYTKTSSDKKAEYVKNK